MENEKRGSLLQRLFGKKSGCCALSIEEIPDGEESPPAEDAAGSDCCGGTEAEGAADRGKGDPGPSSCCCRPVGPVATKRSTAPKE